MGGAGDGGVLGGGARVRAGLGGLEIAATPRFAASL